MPKLTESERLSGVQRSSGERWASVSSLTGGVDLNDPTTVALLAAEGFERARFSYAIYGGLLVAAYGEPRETRDADFAVVDLTVRDARRALETERIETQISFEDVCFGGLSVSRLAILGSTAFTGLNTIDLVRPRSDRYAADAVGRAPTVPVRDRRVRVLTPEDFVLFKALSTRDRDLEDAASVLRRSRAVIDFELVETEIESLSLELPDFDVKARYAALQRRSEGA